MEASGPVGGSEADFTAFVARLERRLVAYLASAGGRDRAEDLFQDVCLALHREWERVRRLERPESWVFRVAHNMAMNSRKRRRVEQGGEERLRAEAGELAASDAPAERAELAARVRDALDRLDSQEREAVALKVWGGLSWVEIAVALDVSEDQAARLFARGLRALAPHLRGFREVSP